MPSLVLRIAKQSQRHARRVKRDGRSGRGRPRHDRRIVSGVHVSQPPRLVAQHDEHRRHEAIVRCVAAQVLVDLPSQRQGVRINSGNGPDERLDVGRQERRRHPFARDVGHGEQRAVVRELDDVEVVAADAAERPVHRLDFVARHCDGRLRLQCLLYAPCSRQVRFELGLAQELRRQHPVHDQAANHINRSQTVSRSSHVSRPDERPDQRARDGGVDRVSLEKDDQATTRTRLVRGISCDQS